MVKKVVICKICTAEVLCEDEKIPVHLRPDAKFENLSHESWCWGPKEGITDPEAETIETSEEYPWFIDKNNKLRHRSRPKEKKP